MKKSTTLALACALLAGTGIRLSLALTTWGTNDVTYWQTFKDWIVQHGSVSIYRGIWYYNHPPMMSGWLWLVHHLQAYAPFPLWIRLPAILADIGNSLLVYRLVRHFWDERRALRRHGPLEGDFLNPGQSLVVRSRRMVLLSMEDPAARWRMEAC